MNYPDTAMPGSIINVTGSGFGSTPRVYFVPKRSGTPITVKLIKADNNFVAFEVPSSLPFDIYEIAISDGKSWSYVYDANQPRARHFDVPEIASNDSFRIFGRNLYVASGQGSPTVSLVSKETGVYLTAAVDLSKSDAYSLTLTAPAGIVAGNHYFALVSNGFASNWSDLCLNGRAAAGDDHFNLGVPWGRDFIYQNGSNYKGTADNGDHHVYDVTSDPFLAIHAKGDGVADDQPAIQAAINQAAGHGGGVVYLPAGTYRLASPAGSYILMGWNVVLQGHSASDTTILMGPATQQPASYTFLGFYWTPNAKMSGLADLSIKNIDTLSQVVKNAVSGGPTSKLFIARVNWDLGTGLFLNFTNADRMVVVNSTFHQSINNQMPNANYPAQGGVGPIVFQNLTNFTFRNNIIGWASSGNAFLTISSGVIEGNHFTRSASDKIVVTAANINYLNSGQAVTIGESVQRQMGRQLSVEFAWNVAIQNNIFDVADGVLLHNNYDGETILSEGGAFSPEADVGTVTSASTTSVTDSSKCAGTCKWTYFPPNNFNWGSKIAIVSGQGSGQWRQIVSLSNNTFTVSPAWSVTPAPGDHFSIFVPSMENVIIRNNVMQNNPAGILLYAAGFYNVSIVNNTITDNGGIFLFSIQNTSGVGLSSPKSGQLRSIEVNGNTVTNTKGLNPAYIAVNAALDNPTSIWGTGLDNIVVRNNSIKAKPGTPAYIFPDGGYTNSVSYNDPNGPYSPNGAPFAILGTIFQGNNCTNCPVFYNLSTGVSDTIIWNSIINAAPAAASSAPVISDQKLWGTATQASAGTVIGHD
jgi:hypothetical protein